MGVLDSFKLDGKVVIVTGASSALGVSFAQAFAEAGADVVLGARRALINNAGVGAAYPATRETPEQFRSVIDVNLNGAYWVARACGRVMLLGRIGDPAELAATAVWLASPAGGYVTGQTIVVDGGQSIT